MSFLKKTFVILAMVGLIIPSLAFAAYGLEGAAKNTGLIGQDKPVTESTVPELIGSIVAVALSFVGAIFFLLILYAGFLWMTAFGAADKVDKAKSILEHAAIGLLIVLAAYAISRFVFTSLGGLSGGETASPNAGVLCGQATNATACGAVVNNNNESLCFWIDEGEGCVPL